MRTRVIHHTGNRRSSARQSSLTLGIHQTAHALCVPRLLLLLLLLDHTGGGHWYRRWCRNGAGGSLAGIARVEGPTGAPTGAVLAQVGRGAGHDSARGVDGGLGPGLAGDVVNLSVTIWLVGWYVIWLISYKVTKLSDLSTLLINIFNPPDEGSSFFWQQDLDFNALRS